MPVAGTQRVLTRGGPVPVKSLVGQRVEVWDGEFFGFAAVAREGLRPVLDVLLSDGTSVRCTADHPFHVPCLSSRDYRRPVPASAVHKGLRLARTRAPVVDPEARLAEPYLQGAYSVCGRESDTLKTLVPGNARVAAGVGVPVGETADVTALVTMPKCHVPTGGSLECKRAWVRGLLDAIGAPEGGRQLVFRDQGFMCEVRDLLLSCGTRCSVVARPGDVAWLVFSAEDAERLRVLVLPGGKAGEAGGGESGGAPGRARLRLLGLGRRLARRAARESPPVTVRSVVAAARPCECYSCPGAMLI